MREGRSREDRDLLTQPGPGPSAPDGDIRSGDQGHHAKPGTVPREGCWAEPRAKACRPRDCPGQNTHVSLPE